MAGNNNESNDDEFKWVCAICLDEEEIDTRYHDCHLHSFHKDCLERAKRMNPACPICRYVAVSARLPITMTVTHHFGLQVAEPCKQCDLPITSLHTFWQFAGCRHRIHNGCYNGNAHCPAC